MKYDPATRRVERTPEDRERHRQVRERLTFARTPTADEVVAAVDCVVSNGLLPGATRDFEAAARALTIERERQGLSRADLATRLGLDEATVSGLESGAVPNASVRTLHAWANALGKKLQVLVLDG